MSQKLSHPREALTGVAEQIVSWSESRTLEGSRMVKGAKRKHLDHLAGFNKLRSDFYLTLISGELILSLLATERQRADSNRNNDNMLTCPSGAECRTMLCVS